MITTSLIKAINPQLPEARCAEIASGLQTAAQAAQITTPARVAAFLAQLAHESCGFRYSEEIWGPTAAQRRYEGRRDLGNTQKGDGYRYRGRGWALGFKTRNASCFFVLAPTSTANPRPSTYDSIFRREFVPTLAMCFTGILGSD